MQLSPQTGWKNFLKADDVTEFIAGYLSQAEQDGTWEYYNFAENSSLWCSDEIKGTNQLQLVFESDEDDAPIKSLFLEFTNNGGPHFKQLYRLKKQLKDQFDIQPL